MGRQRHGELGQGTVPESERRARIRIGPSGWSYPDWKGIVYPAGAGSRFDALRYMSEYFDAIEVNTSFYRPPTPKTTRSWVRRVSDREGFRFAFKLWQRFTHERTGIDAGDVDAVRAGLDPVFEAGLLGCVLMQFPWSFRNTAESIDWLASLAGRFGGYPLVAEVRHDSWDGREARARFAELGVGICNIDQPSLGRCLGPAAHATGRIGYVRFHGRRNDTWFAENARPSDRYDYLYGEGELREWVGRIDSIASQTDEVYVFTNNHYRGQAPANALQLRAMMENRKVSVPAELAVHFRFLEQISAASVGDGWKDGTLFEM